MSGLTPYTRSNAMSLYNDSQATREVPGAKCMGGGVQACPRLLALCTLLSDMSFNLSDYFPVVLMFVVAAGFAVTFITLSQLVGQRKPTRTKLMPYECGKDPVGSARERFSVKFYLIAMIFILFDIRSEEHTSELQSPMYLV